jgi:hypothetical protein
MSNEPGRNSLCPCGSSKKYKRCHGLTNQSDGVLNTPQDINQAIFISAFAEALHDRRLSRSQNDVDVLLTGYSVLHRRLGRCLDRALKSLTDYEKRRNEEKWKQGSKGSASEHLDDYLDCVYAAAELYEFYNQDVVNFLDLQDRKEYKSKLKALKREITAICNQCKHEHGFLQAIDVLYNGGEGVAGFCVYKRILEHIRVNGDIHLRKEAFSLNWSFRRMLGNLMQADLLAAELIAKVPDNIKSEKIKSIAYTLPYALSLKNITERSMAAMPNEITKPLVKLNGKNLYLDPNPAPLKKNGEGELVGFFDVLGGRICCELPYVEGEIRGEINDQSGKVPPMPVFVRIATRGVKVYDQ